MVYKFFDKKASGNGIKSGNISNKELAAELHKPISRNFNKRKVHYPLIDNIWGADLADMPLKNKSNKWYKHLLRVIDIHSKYACVIPLKDRNSIKITSAF